MFGNRSRLIGSNYVWGWESNRIAREVVEGSGGTVVGEKYLHLRNSNVTELIEAILSTEVDFVLNSTVRRNLLCVSARTGRGLSSRSADVSGAQL